MTRDEFLARCGNAFDAGLATPQRLQLLDRWLDFVMRLEGGQMRDVAKFLNEEKERHGFREGRMLAGDADGYALIQLAAILVHPCQACAIDPNAWWTRSAFCEHREKPNEVTQ